MNRTLTLLLGALLHFTGLFAQLTLKVTAIPANTPPGASVYVAGNFNGWNPGSNAHKLSPLGGGQFQIVLNPPPGEIKFKFTLGDWDHVEEQLDGSFLQDRSFAYSGQPATVEAGIATWKGFSGNEGTAAANVRILSNGFNMPQFNRQRRVWLYLPPDYATSRKRYPVLYLQDGQNLFDEETSVSGEWKVDETLNRLFSQGDYGCIVVGIDNGEGDRLDEYSPWVNEKYHEGGDGKKYLDFLVNTLKPYIDANYRTLPDRNSTGIGGSSMGALIAMYAFSERQDVFSRVLVFSPAFWFGGENSFHHVAGHAKNGDARVYFMSGTDEEDDGDESNYVVEDMVQVADAMGAAGFPLEDKYLVTHADGAHSEWFWAREFGDAYLWLFAGATTPESTFDVYPSPAGLWLRISGAGASDKVGVKVYTASGKLLRNSTVSGGDAVSLAGLAPGSFKVKFRKNNGKWITKKMVK